MPSQRHSLDMNLGPHIFNLSLETFLTEPDTKRFKPEVNDVEFIRLLISDLAKVDSARVPQNARLVRYLLGS
jgi:hypothetical protein